ncbi:hypothetical protein VR41_06505 [Streptomyces sp. NRRL B-1568]|nr:hypothetical protein VR41_06505 [Streptomyces sp. NRRL B-1568]
MRGAWADFNAEDAAESARDARPQGPADRDQHPWAAPGWATVLALLIVPMALTYGCLAPMATDSCGPDNCSQALNDALAGVFLALCATVFGTPVMLLTSWVLPRRKRFAVARRALAWCALLPPVTVLLMVNNLPQ